MFLERLCEDIKEDCRIANTILIIAVLTLGGRPARPIIVDDDRPADFSTIQAAVDLATDGDLIVVQPGRYTGFGNRDIDFKGKKITVRGSVPDDPDVVDQTVIDCNGTAHGFLFHMGEDANSVLSGLTVTNASALGGFGSAVEISFGNPTIANCNFTGNEYAWAVICGHGVPDKTIKISNCRIRDNQSSAILLTRYRTILESCEISSNQGDAIQCDSLTATDCIITDNELSAVIQSVGSLIRCEIKRNGGYPGAVAFFSGRIAQCTIADNRSAAFSFSQPESPLEIADTVISGNLSDHDAIYFSENSFTMTRCLVSRNTARHGVGGIMCANGASVVIRNCTFANNAVEQPIMSATEIVCSASAKVGLQNSIVRSEQTSAGAPIRLESGATLAVYHSNIGDPTTAIESSPDCNVVWGPGNVEGDPCFADPNNDDYHLKSQAGRFSADTEAWVADDVTSPCIDAGNPLDPVGAEPFPNGGAVNMGAYGGTEKASKSYFGKTPCQTIMAGDINGDCSVDWLDFRLMSLHWCEDNSL